MELSQIVIQKDLNGLDAMEILKAVKALPPADKLFSSSPVSAPFKLEEDEKVITNITHKFSTTFIQLFLPKQQASYAHPPKNSKDVYMAIGKPYSLTFTYKERNYQLHLGPPVND